jgi:methyl-accepting chemotaxis protein
MFPYKKDVAVTVMYVALKKTTGLADLQMKVYDEVGGLFTTVTLSEVSGNGGLYTGSFTPDEAGSWRARIQSVANKDDVQRLFEVNLVGIDDVDSTVTNIDGNVTSIKGTVESTASDVTSVKGTVESTASDVTSVKGTVESTASDVTSIKGTVESTASDVTSIKGTVETIADEITTGGYIL